MDKEGDHSLAHCHTIYTVSRAAAHQEAANGGRIVMEESCDRETGRLVAAPFLVKTYRFVDDPSTDRIVSWGNYNNTFVVWRPKEFSTSILPRYFNHTNFASFVRQLNTYGFRKVVRGRSEFAHELFRKGQKQLLSHIQRRKSCTTSATKASQMVKHHKTLSLIPTSPSTAPHSGVPAAAASLSEENEILKRNNSLLLLEIARLQNICAAISHSLFGTTPGRLVDSFPSLIDMNRSKVLDNAMNRKTDSLQSRSSFMTDVAEESNMNPPELFGVRLC